jgi:glycerophosphoryl diester phosphodiesterase
MNQPLTVSALAGSVWQDFRRAWGSLIVFEVLFKLLEAWLLLPLLAMGLSAVLSRAGHLAISNRDILDFLLSPSGLLYIAIAVTVVVALLLFEQGAIMVIVARAGRPERPTFRQILGDATLNMFRVVQLSAVKVVLLALALLPITLLAVLTYGIFLTQHDIYFYLKDRPPVFWIAAAIGVFLLLAAVVIGLWLYVRWAFALPILLFERQFAPIALYASGRRIHGIVWRVGALLLGWLLVSLVLGVSLAAGFRHVAAAVLENAGERPITQILLLLAAQGGLLAVLSFVAVVGLSLLTRRLYLTRSEQLGLLSEKVEALPTTEKPSSPWAQRLVYLSLTIVLLTPLALWANLTWHLPVRRSVQVTAHRGHSRAAPENTLSALRKAIESRADYVEMDVHLTGDGVIVLLHDRDLKRVAGVSRRLDELSFDEVRKLDVGSWFDPAFAGERVPTLEEAIHLCRGRIKMNIELKVFGSDRRLAAAVARLIREQAFESDCVITSLDYEALLEAKRHNPRLRMGLIIAHALGDVNRLDVEVLSVRADWLSDDVLRTAHHLGREVFVWTINDARQMIRLIQRGVDNIITSDADLGVRVRDDWAKRTEAERLVLSSRLLLGLEP